MKREDRRNRLGEIASIASALRAEDAAQNPAPDLTASILSRVDAQRPFLDRATRRAIWVGRIGLGASVALIVLGACVAWRLWPEKMDLSNQPTPLSSVVDTVGSHADMPILTLKQAVGTVGQTEPARIIQAMTLRVEAHDQTELRVGPCMPAYEIVARGVGIGTQTHAALAGRQMLSSSKYKTAGPAQSSIQSVSVRPVLFMGETPVYSGTLIDEHDLDAGMGPK